MKSACGFLLAALMLQSPGPGAVSSDAFRFTRAVRIEQGGWARVALDVHAAGHGAADGGWRVFDPDGEAISHAILRPRGGAVSARTLGIEQSAEGWSVVFDLGPTPLRHRKFEVSPVEPVAALGCRLEGSRDGTSWEHLAEGDLFRLGAGDDMVRSALEYGATDARYLRLTWPRDAGLPEFQRATVETSEEAPGGLVTAEVAVRPMDSSESRTSYRLELPAPGIRPQRLELRGEAPGAVGYRLFRVERQRRELLKEGTLDFAEGVSLDLENALIQWPVLYLDLYTARGETARLEGVEVALPPLWLLFAAPEVGTYTLAYGPEGKAPPAPDPVAPESVTEPVVEASLGFVEISPPPALPERVTAPSREIEGSVLSSWLVVSDGATPGELVRLELPEAVYLETDGDLRGLRLVADGKYLPFVHWPHPEPGKAFEARGLTPEPSPRAATSQVSVDLAVAPSALTQIELLSPEGPFTRRVTVQYTRNNRPGVEVRPVQAVRDWRCAEAPLLPCRLDPNLLPERASSRMRVLFEDGQNTPLASVDVLAWRRRDVFLFVRPDAEDVRLVQLYDEVRPPTFELGDLEEQVLHMPWTEGRLDLESALAERDARKGLWRLAMIAALILTAAAVLAIVGRKLLPG